MRPAARQLFRSAREFLALPDFLQLWPGHGAGSACGKALGAVPVSTVGYERRFNPALRLLEQGEEAFVDTMLDGQPEPPLYFARMKRLNQEGPPLLGNLPLPRHLAPQELAALSGVGGEVVVVDSRADRQAFMRGHLEGSLYAPFGRTFPTITGSYVAPRQEIVLIVAEENLEGAVRGLVRIGLDRIAGWAGPDDLAAVAAAGTPLAAIEIVDFAALRDRLQASLPLDVRREAEFREGRIPGAVNLPHTRLAARLGELPRDRPLLVHCLSGARAAAASALLAREGFEVAYVDDDFANFPQAVPPPAVGAGPT